MGNFAVSNPAREILFTAADREDKYKAKNVVDGVVFRGADMASSWIFHLLYAVMGLTVPLLAAVHGCDAHSSVFVSQFIPPNPTRHEQLKLLIKSWHTAPFEHGDDRHSFMFCSHSKPE